jgi:hypothetical protein
MSVSVKQIEELVQELPVEAQEEVLDVVEFLLLKHGRRTGRIPRQDWSGALREHREQYTSIELQHKALDWRGD